MRRCLSIVFTRTLTLLFGMCKRVFDIGTENYDIFRSSLQVFAKSVLCGCAYVLFFMRIILDRNSQTPPPTFT